MLSENTRQSPRIAFEPHFSHALTSASGLAIAPPSALGPEPPTGIDYLALTAAAHHEQLRGDERIGYHALYDAHDQIPGQLSIDDVADVDQEGEMSA